MTPKDAVDGIIAELVALDVRLGGDDASLANPWEEIKEQLQNELSVYWPAYLETMRQFVAGFVASSNEDELAQLGTALKCTSKDGVERKLLERLLARGKKERINYSPFDFEYFCYPLLDFTVNGRVLERAGLDRCYAQVFFSAAAPTGELGTVECSRIESILSREHFELARARNWPVGRGE